MPGTELRIRGQEVVVRLTQGGVLVASLTAFRSANITWGTRVLTDQYLGETSQRKDTIYDAMKGNLVFVPEGQDFLAFVEFVVAKAKRRVANDAVVNLATRLNFPNGKSPRINVFDLAFGELNLNVPARDQYADFTVPWEAAVSEIIRAP